MDRKKKEKPSENGTNLSSFSVSRKETEPVIPLNQMYSVTRHDKPAPDQTNIPIPDEENVLQSKQFVDENHLD